MEAEREAKSQLMNWLLPIPASAHAGEIDTIMLLVHSLMLALAVGWGGVFCTGLVRFRRSRQPKADYEGAKSRYSTYTEAGIVIAELILLVGFSIPAWATRTQHMPPEHEAVVMRVAGEQFAWNAHYPGADGSSGADVKLLAQTIRSAWTRGPRPARTTSPRSTRSSCRSDGRSSSTEREGRHP